MEFARPVHQLDFARSQIEDPISNDVCHQHRRCADEAASIWDRKDHRPNVYEPVRVPREPSKSNKVVNAYECIPAETINKCIDPYLSIQEKNDGGTVLADDMDSLLCFEDMQNGSFDKHDRFDWHTNCEVMKGISTSSLPCLHEQQNHHICHSDLKPDNILLDDNMVENLADFGTSRLFVDEERTPNMENCIEKSGHTDLEQHTGRNVISKKSASYLILRLLIVLESMIGQLTGTAHKHWRSTLHAREMWVLDSSSKQIKRSNQIVCLETGKSRKATAFDVLTLASGAVIGSMADAAKMKPFPDSNTATDMDLAVLVLALVTTLAAALSMHQHIFWSNLTEERSEKPRSNRGPATNSSDKSTHSIPMATNKLTNNEAENHSDPNSSVAERDRTAEENKRPGGIWYIATGAAHHATGNPDLITNLVELESDALRVHAADGTPMPVRGRGNVVTENIVLPDVYYVPGLCANLVSVGQLAGMDYCVGFGRGACVVRDAAGTVIGRAHARADGLYVADFLRVPLGGTP